MLLTNNFHRPIHGTGGVDRDLLCEVASCIGGRLLAAVFGVMAAGNGGRGGLPDLVRLCHVV